MVYFFEVNNKNTRTKIGVVSVHIPKFAHISQLVLVLFDGDKLYGSHYIVLEKLEKNFFAEHFLIYLLQINLLLIFLHNVKFKEDLLLKMILSHHKSICYQLKLPNVYV